MKQASNKTKCRHIGYHPAPKRHQIKRGTWILLFWLVALASDQKSRRQSTGIIGSTEETRDTHSPAHLPPRPPLPGPPTVQSTWATTIHYTPRAAETLAGPGLDQTRTGLDKHLPSTSVAWLVSYLPITLPTHRNNYPSFDSSCFVILSHRTPNLGRRRAKSYLTVDYTLVDPRHNSLTPILFFCCSSHPVNTNTPCSRSRRLSTATPAVAVQPGGAWCPRPTRGRSDPSHRL